MEILVATVLIAMLVVFLKSFGSSKPRTRGSRKSDLWKTSASPARPVPIRDEPIVGLAWVIDGDTIIINKIRIRLFGIDAPELDHPHGQNSKWAMVKLCKGQKITALPDGSVSHDRCVARCYLPDGRDLSAELVKMGLAIDWPKFSNGEYRRLEPVGVRKSLWRAHNRQTGKYVPPPRPKP